MKTKLLILILFSVYNSYSQFSEQLIISTEAGGARGVFAADIDGDGDLDVISAAESDDKVAWYENLDGLGDFSPQNIINQNLNAAVDVFAADLDGDGDNDVLVASKGHTQQEGKVVWFINNDGQGSFLTQPQIISELTLGAVSVFATDLDGDNDLDVLSASFDDNKVAWYKNDGLGNFGTQQIITNTAYSTRDVFAADLDGDNDMDVLTVSTGTDKVIWFENLDGFGNFGAEQIITSNANAVAYIYASDIDNDGDLDVLSARSFENTVAWYENLDGQGNFGVENVITQILNSASQVISSDVDNDGDMDVLASSSNEDKVVWFENLDGQGNFGTEQIISTQTDWARTIYAADIDDDGDMDVLSASKIDNKIAWYRNLTPLGINENVKETIIIYPNPTNDYLFINSRENFIQSVEVFDILGRKLLLIKENFNQLNISNLKNGILFVKIETKKRTFTKKIIKE
tara:strand:+ start:1342 stop:2721 length:1380 start_codon:yes stop_codon:yes gene_type:complete